MNNVSYEIPLKRESLGIPTLDRCIKLLPFKIDTNFYYLPDGALYFTTLKDFHNKNHAIPAPQVHEMKACIDTVIQKSIPWIENFREFRLVEERKRIRLTFFILEGKGENKNISGVFWDGYADFLIDYFDKMVVL